jgi:hypothetical protein
MSGFSDILMEHFQSPRNQGPMVARPGSGGRGLLPARAGDRGGPAEQGVGAAWRDEPGAAVAASGATRRGPRRARGCLRNVH